VGENPQTFSSVDLAEELKAEFDGTQIGSAAAINDDIFGIFALSSVGLGGSDTVIAGARDFILSNQNENGGWGWSVGGGSDSGLTALAIAALLEAGVSSSNTAIQNGVTRLHSVQNDDGGFASEPEQSWGIDSDGNTTAWVVSGIQKLGQDPQTWIKGGKNPIDYLLSLQAEDGFFQWKPGDGTPGFQTTEQVVIALSGTSYPIAKVDAVNPQDSFAPLVSYRIEGSTQTICRGIANVHTPLEVVEEGAEQCGYTFDIQEFEGNPSGILVTRIGEDEEGGWRFFVNWDFPLGAGVDASTVELSEGDLVLWSYAPLGSEPLRLILTDSKDLYSVGESVEGIVESFDGSNWNTVQADVLMNGEATSTSENGLFDIVLSENGVFEMRAEKEGFIRSDVETIVVGDVSDTIALDVEIVQEGGSGSPGDGDKVPEVAFSVNVSQLSFGKLEPGNFVADEVILKNEGEKDLTVKAVVKGDEVFSFLKIADVIWSLFEKFLLAGTQEQVEVRLSVPFEFSSFGSKQGTLMFWGQSN